MTASYNLWLPIAFQCGTGRIIAGGSCSFEEAGISSEDNGRRAIENGKRGRSFESVPAEALMQWSSIYFHLSTEALAM